MIYLYIITTVNCSARNSETALFKAVGVRLSLWVRTGFSEKSLVFLLLFPSFWNFRRM